MTAQQLKNSILQLAVQGKLVPQDPNDEPASVLLERIRAEKEALIKAKKIKREKNPSVIFRGADNIPYEKIGNDIVELDVPFDIPDTWEWIRLSNLVDYSMGKTPPRKESIYWDNPSYPWVSIADMVADGNVTVTKEGISEYAANNAFKGRISPTGTLIMSFKLTVGKVSILGINAYHNEAIISIFPFIDDGRITTSYLFKVLPLISQTGDTKTAIKGNTLNSDSLDNLLIPLPPLEEQQRIVQKIDELSPVLQAYEKAETESRKLDTVFPEQLKKSILQWAVQGKLVPQDPSDEPAEALLERIRGEKERLVREGKIKKDKHESVIFRRDNSHYEKCGSETICIDSELPFDIPDSWSWVRLGSLCKSITDGDHQPPPQVSEGIPFLVISDVSSGSINFANTRYVPALYYNELMESRKPRQGDLLFTVTGSYGIVVKVNVDRIFCFQRHIALIKPLSISADFLQILLTTPLCFEQCKQAATGTAQKTVGLQSLRNLLIPIPPFAEQERILNKINEITKLAKFSL